MNLLTDQVSVGDRFIKVGDYSRTVYVVHSLTNAHGLFQHARLVCSAGRDRLLISTSALLDRNYWSRLSEITDRGQQR
jgi:predicted dinucleotide-utilizing enzyme